MIDIKERLDAELPPPGAAPVRITDETLVHGGRKARRRRRILAGIGTAAAGIVAIAVGVTVLVPASNGPAPAADGDEPVPSESDSATDPGPAFEDISQLNPDMVTEQESYLDPSEQELAPAYSEALLAQIEKLYPDLGIVYAPDDSGKPVAIEDSTGLITMAKVGRRVVEDQGDAGNGEPDPYFDTFFYETRLGPLDYAGEDGDSTSYGKNLFFALDGEAGANDAVNVRYYPQGGFIQGAENSLDLGYCYFAVQDDCMHDEVSGPDGSDVVEVWGIQDQTLGDGDDPVHQVVMYRSDGSAIVVTNTVNTLDGPATSVTEPTLSFKQLTAIAAAMPMDVLE